jgi:hypothetical protein
MLINFGALSAGVLVGRLTPLPTVVIPAKQTGTWIAVLFNFELKHSIALALLASIAVLLKVIFERPSGKNEAIHYFFLGLCLSWPFRH